LGRKSLNKIELKNAKIQETEGNFKIIERDEFDDSIKLEEYLSKEILSQFKNSERVKFIIKETKHRNMKTPEPKYTFKCKCGTKIKTKNQELHVHCNDCQSDFELAE
jgi:hypothetical protein